MRKFLLYIVGIIGISILSWIVAGFEGWLMDYSAERMSITADIIWWSLMAVFMHIMVFHYDE